MRESTERPRGRQRPGPVELTVAMALCTLLSLQAAQGEAIDLARLLLSEAQAGGNWDVVEEVPEDVARDADFLAWGVDAQRARHYTRFERRRVEVCSIEIWRFLTARLAQHALREIDYPHWEIGGSARHLVLVRGLTAEPGMQPRRGVFPDCHQLGQRVRARVEEIAD